MSQFGVDKFTTKAREAVEAAQTSAITTGNSSIEPIHLLVSLLLQEDGTAASLVAKTGVDAGTLVRAAAAERDKLPTASGASVATPSASGSLTRVLASAMELAQSMKDDYVTTEHLLIALATV